MADATRLEPRMAGEIERTASVWTRSARQWRLENIDLLRVGQICHTLKTWSPLSPYSAITAAIDARGGADRRPWLGEVDKGCLINRG